jgi:hypothetical protein
MHSGNTVSTAQKPCHFIAFLFFVEVFFHDPQWEEKEEGVHSVTATSPSDQF